MKETLTTPKKQIDNLDFQILGLIASVGTPQVSSWTICRLLYPNIKNPQNHLSSVIWRLDKLTGLHFLIAHPHPKRAGKKVYALPEYAFSIDGTVFIPSPIGGIIVNCRFKKDKLGHGKSCEPCVFGGPDCELHTAILKEGLEPVLRIAERLAAIKNNKIKKEKKKEEIQNINQTGKLAPIQV